MGVGGRRGKSICVGVRGEEGRVSVWVCGCGREKREEYLCGCEGRRGESICVGVRGEEGRVSVWVWEGDMYARVTS